MNLISPWGKGTYSSYIFMSLTLILGIIAIYGGMKLRKMGNDETKIIGWVLMVIGGIIVLYHIFPIVIEILRITIGTEVSKKLIEILNPEKFVEEFLNF